MKDEHLTKTWRKRSYHLKLRDFIKRMVDFTVVHIFLSPSLSPSNMIITM